MLAQAEETSERLAGGSSPARNAAPREQRSAGSQITPTPLLGTDASVSGDRLEAPEIDEPEHVDRSGAGWRFRTAL